MTMTDKHIPASKLLALKDYWDERMGCMTVRSDDIRALIATEPESVAGKWVPFEPTDEMIYRGGEATSKFIDWSPESEDEQPERVAHSVYKAMLSAAPPADNLIAELVEALSALVDKELFCTDKEIIGGIDVQDVLKARELLKRAKEVVK